MRYAILIHEVPEVSSQLSEEELRASHAEYMAISEMPGCVGGAQLQSVETASTVRVQDGEALVTDGPFADTKEVFGGFYLFELPNVDEALEVAARIPAARHGGSVEIRPLVEN
jgi:hypothetical protein